MKKTLAEAVDFSESGGLKDEFLPEAQLGGIELVDLGDDQQAGEICKCHEAGAGIHAGGAHDNLPFANGDFQDGAIEGSEDPGFGKAVINGLAASQRFIETVFLDSEVGHHVEKFLFAQEPALVKLTGAVEVTLGLSHGEPRTFDLCLRCGTLVEEIGVINRH